MNEVVFDKLHARRLSQLADNLENVEYAEFRWDYNFATNGSEGHCGTAGCAIGRLPLLFPKEWEYDGRGDPRQVGGETLDGWFGLSDDEASHLFIPGSQRPSRFGGKYLGGDATREDVSEVITDFLRVKAQEVK